MKNHCVKRQLSAFLDDALTKDERKFVESHLEVCDSCRETLARTKAAWDLVGILPEAGPSSHAFIKIKARMASQTKDTPLSKLERFLVPAATAAALVMGMWVGSIVGKNGDDVLSYEAPPSESSVYMETFDDLPSGSLAKIYIDLASVE